MESQPSIEQTDKTYIRKAELSEEEMEYNEKLFEETLTILFPEDKMKDKFFRDKVR